MARILATCETCGDVELGVADVQVRVVGGSGGDYTFTCPVCGSVHSKAADPRIVDLLAAAGVVMVSVPRPASRATGADPARPRDISPEPGGRWHRSRKRGGTGRHRD